MPGTVRPAPSTLGVAGERGSRHESCSASITLDTYGHLFPDELEALAGRMEDACTEARATLARTQRGPAVVPLREGAGQ